MVPLSWAYVSLYQYSIQTLSCKLYASVCEIVIFSTFLPFTAMMGKSRKHIFYPL